LKRTDILWLYTQPLQNIGGAKVCIVLGKWVSQTFIYGYIVTKYRCNSLKYIISQGGVYYLRFFAFFIVKYIIIIPCRVLHSEYIFQLPNHARDGACRSHWSTTGLILYGWPNKNFELNIIDMRRHGLWRGRTYIFEIKIVSK
jgi:hypothetical protein